MLYSGFCSSLFSVFFVVVLCGVCLYLLFSMFFFFSCFTVSARHLCTLLQSLCYQCFPITLLYACVYSLLPRHGDYDDTPPIRRPSGPKPFRSALSPFTSIPSILDKLNPQYLKGEVYHLRDSPLTPNRPNPSKNPPKSRFRSINTI